MLRNLNQSAAGTRVLGTPKTGVLAENIPATGDNGPGYAYPSLSLPADSGKEICGTITTWPTDGELIGYEDTSYEFSGAADGPYWFDWRLIVNGVASSVDIGYGAGIARAFLQVGPAYAAVAATSDDAIFSGGAIVSAVPASAAISTTTEGAEFYGSAFVSGGSPSVFVWIAASTDSAVFSGSAYVTPSFRVSATSDSAIFSGLVLFGGTPVYTRAPSGSGYGRRKESTFRPPQTNTVRP